LLPLRPPSNVTWSFQQHLTVGRDELSVPSRALLTPAEVLVVERSGSATSLLNTAECSSLIASRQVARDF
jgi:hypothetical protein